MNKITISNNRTQIINLLKSVPRSGMPEFLNWLQATDFFEAPASSIYHLNTPGGLAYHSISVYKTLRSLSKTFNIPIPADTLIITALLHDVCKIDTYKIKEGDGVALSPKATDVEYRREGSMPLGHGEKSVILILSNGLDLNNQEIGMIRWHMAMYDPSYQKGANYIKKHYPLAKLLYFADDISTTYLEEIQ